MLFLSTVLVPLVKADPDPAKAQQWFIQAARRFRTFVWGAVGVLILSGIVLLPRHVSFSEPFFNWPPIVLTKLSLVTLLLAISIAHEFIIAPKVRSIKQKNPSSCSPSDLLLVKISPWIARLTLVTGVAIFFVAVVLARS